MWCAHSFRLCVCVRACAGIVSLAPLNLVSPQTPHKICRLNPQYTRRSKMRVKGFAERGLWWSQDMDGWGWQRGGGWGSVLKSPRTWILVCHANCSDAIECGHREQKVHRTPGILMQSLSEPSLSSIHPPSPPFAKEIYDVYNGHTHTDKTWVGCLVKKVTWS